MIDKVLNNHLCSVIDLSYALSRQDGILGSPERPLSDLGLISYRSYWKDVIVRYILTLQDDQKFSIRELSLQSGILQNDLVSTLQYMQVKNQMQIKTDPFTSNLSGRGSPIWPKMTPKNPNQPQMIPNDFI